MGGFVAEEGRHLRLIGLKPDARAEFSFQPFPAAASRGGGGVGGATGMR